TTSSTTPPPPSGNSSPASPNTDTPHDHWSYRNGSWRSPLPTAKPCSPASPCAYPTPAPKPTCPGNRGTRPPPTAYKHNDHARSNGDHAVTARPCRNGEAYTVVYQRSFAEKAFGSIMSNLGEFPKTSRNTCPLAASAGSARSCTTMCGKEDSELSEGTATTKI